MDTFSDLLDWSPVNSPHKGQWHGTLMLSLICAWINGWVNNREAGVFRRHRALSWRHSNAKIVFTIMVTDPIGRFWWLGAEVPYLASATSNRTQMFCAGSVINPKILQWRHHERDGVSNPRLLDCLYNRSFRRRSKKWSKLRVTVLCGESIDDRRIPVQRTVTWKIFPFDDVIPGVPSVTEFQYFVTEITLLLLKFSWNFVQNTNICFNFSVVSTQKVLKFM